MTISGDKKDNHYVGRGALKLKYGLEYFNINVKDKTAADLGCSTGGFTEVLLEKGARKVYAVDTAYGQLDWKLRKDDRVVVMERTNALHAELEEKVDLVVIDAGWTAQKLIVPKAMELLKAQGDIVTLVKPHYEAKRYGLVFKGKKLTTEESGRVLESVLEDLKKAGFKINLYTTSPVTGEKGKNIEYLVWINKKEKKQ
ncbi:MAG: SAM-dependent methyltransferase [Candidatus Falkowbacteria bacterium]